MNANIDLDMFILYENPFRYKPDIVIFKTLATWFKD